MYCFHEGNSVHRKINVLEVDLKLILGSMQDKISVGNFQPLIVQEEKEDRMSNLTCLRYTDRQDRMSNPPCLRYTDRQDRMSTFPQVSRQAGQDVRPSLRYTDGQDRMSTLTCLRYTDMQDRMSNLTCLRYTDRQDKMSTSLRYTDRQDRMSTLTCLMYTDRQDRMSNRPSGIQIGRIGCQISVFLRYTGGKMGMSNLPSGIQTGRIGCQTSFASGIQTGQGQKKPGFKKKPAQWFFFIFAQKRELLGFFSFKNTFRCIQTLNYNQITLTN